ncbi:MAG: GNAT family N-acetyltransferase [Terriglobia bacterium]
MEATISLRSEQPEDQDMVRSIYASTRTAEMDVAPWTDDQKEAFLNMQFRLQTAHFRRNYPDASFDIILENGAPVGRLYVAREVDEVCILDIAVLPDYRGKGIGTLIVRRLMVEASDRGAPLRLHVERNNRALRLYDRLGFQVITGGPVYLEMEWRQVKQ